MLVERMLGRGALPWALIKGSLHKKKKNRHSLTFYQSGGNPPPSLARFFSSWALLEVMASLRQGSLQVIYLKVVIYFGKA